MKAFLMLVAVFVALAAAPAVADDGQVPQSTLRAVGLGSMQVASDDQGMQVRGRQSAFVADHGTSLIFGQLLSPDAKNLVEGSSVNEVNGNGETTNTGTTTTTKDHQVVLFLNLAVAYTGNIGAFDAPAFAAGSGTVSVTLP
jgi:opacity protein-like surface antigen